MKNVEYGYCGIICSDCKNYKKNMNCLGCHHEKELLEDCPIRKCAISKNLNSCMDCNMFPCDTFSEFYNDGKSLHKKAYENLISLKNKKYQKSNEELWDINTKYHYESDFYNVEEFIKGKTSLLPIELNELPLAVGDMKDKKMLHLQCHFGLDTLSWARLGANVTGVDFSSASIEYAKKLSNKTGLNARFVCSNIYDLPDVLDEKESFDIVYTSYGVLVWLNDLSKWANIISYYLKKGGIFYIAEIHPFIMVFENEDYTEDLRVKYDYFHKDLPYAFNINGTYADKNANIKKISYEWFHSLSDIINSLINSGLKIEFFNEHPFCCYDHFPFMKKNDDGLWVIDKNKIKTNENNLKDKIIPDLPLTFSILARKL